MNSYDQDHPWINNSNKSILNQPFFELIDLSNWSKEMGDFYKRVNESPDERSFVILMTLVVEYHVDAIFRAFFPNNKDLLENISLTFALRISILKSLRLLPDKIFDFADIVRKIRNEFAHKVEIDKIIELNEYTKGKKLIQTLDSLCKHYKESLTYSKYQQENYREKFKDISNFAISALREYEPAVKLVRKEIERPAFIGEIIKRNKFKIII